MPTRRLASLLLATACALATSCSNNDGKNNGPLIISLDQGADQASADMPADMPATLPDRCVPGNDGWTEGVGAFSNATTTSGMEALAAIGTRISAGDLNGDGYADLIVRRASNQAAEHDFSEGGTGQVWVLMNKGDGTFTDTTAASGLLARRDGKTGVGRPAEIMALGDVDNDGDLDVITLFSNSDAQNVHPETAELMLNRGDGTFELGPKDGTDLRVGGTYSRGGVAFTDLNRDGFLDVWVGTGGPGQDLLYLGNGQGALLDNTRALGLTTRPWQSLDELNAAQAHTNSWGVTACDLNNDGSPELLSASYGRAPNHLWQSAYASGGVSMTNRSVASGYAFDARQDWTDNESARCYCTLHPDAEGCAGVPAPTRIACQQESDVFRWNHANDREPFRLGGNSGTTVCADVNNDGWMDLLTTEIVHWDVGKNSDPSELLINQKRAEVTFARPGNEVTGLTRTQEVDAWNDGDITAAVFDFDNDGRPDLYIGTTDYPGTRGHLYHQRPDGTFVEVPIAQGIDHKSSHGVAVADYDRDGDLDLVIGHSRGRCSSGDHCYPSAHTRYFQNTLGNTNNWIQLQLEGASANRAAIGARVTVKTDAITQTQEVQGGHGHYGLQDDLVRHFGLGRACAAEVTVRWPDAELSTQTFTVQAGYRYTVRQGQAPVAQTP